MIDEIGVQRLVKESVLGDRESFGKIYDIFSDKIFNFILYRVRNKQTAEDILQTVFLKAWNNLPKYSPTNRAKFSTWLFQIANFTVIDYWRTKKDTIEIDKLENLSQFAVEPKLYENYKFLWGALEQLPSDYQLVLRLRFIDDLSVTEAAWAMNRSEVGIRVLQHRALKALRNILIKNGHDNL
ncbi:MAG: RNA polymerase sigma factor [Candidatus Doudnabacteria bacterium]|nr:RNA polymerase sigma factor [Candidatus Doudnabacteria bacterium]